MVMLPDQCPVCKEKQLRLEPQYAVCTHCSIYRKKLNILQQVTVWASTHAWWWRVPILLWFAYVVTKYLHASDYVMNRTGNIISSFDLGIHELGHFLFIPLGEFMTILGGSLFQVLFPLVWAGIALYKRWFFAFTMILVWVGLSLIDVSIYAADAQDRILPLVTVGSNYDDAHDWYQILTRLDALEHTNAVANWIRVVGKIFAYTGLGLGAGLLAFALKRSLSHPVKQL